MKLKNVKRGIAGVLVLSCVIGLAGCSNDNKTQQETDNVAEYNFAEGIYAFEPIELDIDKEASVSDYYIKGNELYYTYTVYPEIPDDVLEQLESVMEDSVEDSVEEQEDNAVENADDNVVDESNKEAEEDMEIENDSSEISDDELLGDMDDLFGDEGEENTTDNQTQEVPEVQEEQTPEEKYEEIYKEYAPEMSFCKLNIETGESTKLYDIPYDENSDDSDIVYYIDDEGNKRAVSIKYSYNEATSDSSVTASYVVKDSQGNVISSEDVTDLLLKDGDNPDEVYIDNNSVVTEDGTMYIMVRREAKTEIFKFVEGKSEGSVMFDDYVQRIALDNENNPIITVIAERKSSVSYIDFEKGTIGDVIYEMDESVFTGEIISGKGNIPFFTKNTSGLSVFDKESGEKKEIFKWLDTGIVGDDVIEIIPVSDGRFFCAGYNREGQNNLGYLVKQEGEQQKKKVVTIASLYSDHNVQQRIVEYNKEHDDCKIEYKTYEESEDAEKALANDIIAGNVPDILNVSYIDTDSYISKGVFEDLGPYLEKDEQINKEYFYDGILDKTAIDGKNYYLTKYYALSLLCGRKAELEKYADGWKVQDLIDYYNSKPEGKILFPYENSDLVMYELFQKLLFEYIDWNTGEVNFDSEDLKKGLEFSKSFPESLDDMSDFDIRKEVKDGNLLLNTISIYEVSEMRLQQKLFDDDVVYLGYPMENNSGIMFRSAGDAYAISSTSECKDEAWDFIKHIMLSKDDYMQGLPASKAEFEKMVKRETTTVEYTEEDGTVVKPKDEMIGYNDFNVKVKPVKQDVIDKLKELIDKSVVAPNNTEIMMLIDADIKAYFDGSKSLDDTIKIVQDKVSKYVNENR